MTSPYRVEWSRPALKGLDRLDRTVRVRVLRKVDSLKAEPRPPGVLRLTGQRELWRLRVGDYRVIYTIQDSKLVITVVDVGGRGSIYREF